MPAAAGVVRHRRLPILTKDRTLQIWVDADACRGEIKERLYRAAKRTQTRVTLVANQGLRTPPSEFIDSIMVSSGMNVADRRIVNRRNFAIWRLNTG